MRSTGSVSLKRREPGVDRCRRRPGTAQRRDERDAAPRGEQRDQLERRRVGPLQVVDDDRLADRLEQLGEREPESGAAGGAERRRGLVGEGGGHQPRELGAVPGEAGQLGERGQGVFHIVDQRLQRRTAARFLAGQPGRGAEGRLDQPGLADAGLTRDDPQRRFRAKQAFGFSRAADQGRAQQRHRRRARRFGGACRRPAAQRLGKGDRGRARRGAEVGLELGREAIEQGEAARHLAALSCQAQRRLDRALVGGVVPTQLGERIPGFVASADRSQAVGIAQRRIAPGVLDGAPLGGDPVVESGEAGQRHALQQRPTAELPGARPVTGGERGAKAWHVTVETKPHPPPFGLEAVAEGMTCQPLTAAMQGHAQVVQRLAGRSVGPEEREQGLAALPLAVERQPRQEQPGHVAGPLHRTCVAVQPGLVEQAEQVGRHRGRQCRRARVASTDRSLSRASAARPGRSPPRRPRSGAAARRGCRCGRSRRCRASRSVGRAAGRRGSAPARRARSRWR